MTSSVTLHLLGSTRRCVDLCQRVLILFDAVRPPSGLMVLISWKKNKVSTFTFVIFSPFMGMSVRGNEREWCFSLNWTFLVYPFFEDTFESAHGVLKSGRLATEGLRRCLETNVRMWSRFAVYSYSSMPRGSSMRPTSSPGCY